MKSGYKIEWTAHAIEELTDTMEYLRIKWTEKEIHPLAIHLEKTIEIISHNPFIFRASENGKDVRRAVILSLSTLYYRIIDERFEIISFFNNRRNPSKRRI